MMNEDYFEILGRSVVFSGLPAEDVKSSLEATLYQVKQYTKDEIIAQAGETYEYPRVLKDATMLWLF